MISQFYPVMPGDHVRLMACTDQTGRPVEIELPYKTDDQRIIEMLRREFPDRIREVPIIRQKNLVRNPSCEVNTTGWAASTSGTSSWSMTRSSLQAHSGSWSWRLSGGTTGSAGSRASIVQVLASACPIQGGQGKKVSAMGWGYNGSASVYRGFKAEVIWYRADNSQSSIYGGGTQFLPPGMWVQIPFMHGQPPDDAVWGAVRLSVVEPVAGESYFFDSAFLAQTNWREPDEAYFDGDTSQFHTWDGTPHDSTSTSWW